MIGARNFDKERVRLLSATVFSESVAGHGVQGDGGDESQRVQPGLLRRYSNRSAVVFSLGQCLTRSEL